MEGNLVFRLTLRIYVGKVEVLEVKGISYDKLNEELRTTQAELSRITHERINALLGYTKSLLTPNKILQPTTI